MSIKSEVEAEKAKLLGELKAIETKAKEELAAVEAKAKGVFDLGAELTAVETKVKAEVQKVEKWFVSAFKSTAQTAPTVANTTPVVAPVANTASK